MKTVRRLFHFVLALSVLGLALSIAQPAQALGTTITVTGTADNATVGSLNGNTTCDLREAVEVVNTGTTTGECTGGAGPYTIAFNIGAGLQTINLAAALTISDPVVIDGSTEPDYGGTPRIDLDGGGIVNPLLTFGSGADGSTVRALMFTHAGPSSAVNMPIGVDGVTVVGNYFNTDGTAVAGTSAIGLAIGGSNDIIGGSSAADRNLFGGGSGIYQNAGTNDLIEGNYFGVQADGVTALSGQPAIDVAIFIYTSASANGTIRNNVITGFSTGIELYTGVSQVSIKGNKIGVGADGSTALANHYGIYLLGANSNTIGGTTAADRNIISGNPNANIYADDFNSAHPDSNVIEGNYIGTNAAGTAAAGVASSYGIDVEGGAGNQIGGTAAGSGNVISNNEYGIRVGDTSTGTQIFGNRIGTDKTGTSAIANSQFGIYLQNAPADIGDGTTPGKNVVAGNSDGSTIDGIGVNGAGTSGTTIVGNKIGVNAAGSGALANDYGIYVQGGGSPQIAQNWIASNTWYSVYLDATSSVAGGSGNTGNCFANNSAGLANANTGVTADFTGNWWGAVDGPGSVATGSGDPVSLHVDYSGYLTSPAAACSPAVSLSASSLNFGNQLVGTSSTLSVTLTSSGPKVLTFTSITKTGPFSLTGSTCPLGAGTLGSGSSCLIKVKSAPTSTGVKSGSITISTDASTSPDSIALSGTGVSGTQLLKNPSFETDANLDKKPDNWSFVNFIAATDKRDCSVRKSGTCSLRFQGNGTQKVASQTIVKSGVAGDDFTFALWSKASSVPVGSVYRLQVLFYNNSTLKATKTMNFNVGTHIFQKVSGTFTASTAYTKIVYRIQFKAASGTAWFDVADLRWAP